MIKTRSSRRRGVVLIIVLGVLSVLVLLGTTFATLQATERDIARNYLDTVRVKALAMSGVQDAVARLGSAAGGFNDPAMIYWGSNTSETGSPDWTTPLERAQSPSYALEDEAIQNPTDAVVTPLRVTIDGRTVGISGRVNGGTYATNGDLYRVRVTDANSMIHLNDGVEQGKDGPTSLNLKRILNNLGEMVGARLAGDKILELRPSMGYLSKRELADVLGPAMAAKIQPFVTTRAWVDRTVANPVPLSPETLSSYPIKYNQKIGIFRYGRSFGTGGAEMSSWPLRFAPDHADPRGVDHAVMALDELNPQWIEICPRAPLNVNLAPREILTAVIAGLQGVFLVERRKSNPHPWNVYSFMGHPVYDNTPGGRRGDEYGYLYATVPFVAPGGTVTEGIDAAKVADEIIACRTRAKSSACPGLDYGAVWYGGPFRSWRQFNAFCDGLVAGKLLKDERPIYFDFVPASKSGASALTGSDDLVPSPLQPRHAGQALADVLKANFNPNLTLNETNPDANLFTLVDKTDLVTRSTEFCFTPMGIFEIESEGLIVRTEDGRDFLATRRGELVARKKVCSIVKVYDVYRESSQAEFHPGKADEAAGGSVTDNGKTLVLGPEPDLGTAASECRYSGWIQLATIGGPGGHGGADRDAAAHGHFSQSHDLHHHAAGALKALRPEGGPFCNNKDRTESGPGPYDSNLGAPGRHRLAKSWTADKQPPDPAYAAPGDLRIDGAYVERDSALLYENSNQVFGLEGTVAYWVKPSFAPEMTGKPRSYFCVDQTFQQKEPAKTVQLIHGQWFFASHDTVALSSSPNESAPLTYSAGPWVPVSMVAGYSTHGKYGGAVGRVSPSLNHRAHTDGTTPDLLRRNGWIHVAYHWDMNKHDVTLAINGQVLPQTRAIKVHPQNFNRVEDFLQAPLRIGEPSTTMSLNGKVARNWSADSTIDEFYIWKGNRIADAQELWSRGRYYIPRTGKEAVFTSRDLVLVPPDLRPAPPPTLVPRQTVTVRPPQVRILGAGWTWHPETTDKDGLPTVIDYRHLDPLHANVHLTFLLDGVPVGDPLRDDGGEETRGLVVNPGQVLKYRLSLHLPEAELDSILLGTPVVDDVTIYYTNGAEYLYYELYGAGL